ncbi:hypothetical protein [Diaminobutyricimonas aerilata]|uniref:hypothetical protein n=1 Tax=Diaminobutyricimonas aerilata TaxID=1162967 RepID=UPI0012FDB5F7|nr:hypothetical protein [Diaminobutyricimonas aerilata]
MIVGWPDVDGGSTHLPEVVVRSLTEQSEHGIAARLDAQPARELHPRSKLAQIVLPLTAGSPSVLMSSARFASYADSLAWAVMIPERWPDAERIEVVPVVNGRPRSGS